MTVEEKIKKELAKRKKKTRNKKTIIDDRKPKFTSKDLVKEQENKRRFKERKKLFKELARKAYAKKMREERKLTKKKGGKRKTRSDKGKKRENVKPRKKSDKPRKPRSDKGKKRENVKPRKKSDKPRKPRSDNGKKRENLTPRKKSNKPRKKPSTPIKRKPSTKPRKTRIDKGFKRARKGLEDQLKRVKLQNSGFLKEYLKTREEWLSGVMNGDVDAAFTEQEFRKQRRDELDKFKKQIIMSLDERMIEAFKLYLEKASEFYYNHVELHRFFDDFGDFYEYVLMK